MIAYPPVGNNNKVPLLSQNRQFQWFSNPTFLYPLVPASAATLLQHNGFNVLWKDAIAERLTYDEFLEYFQLELPQILVIESKTPVIQRHWQIINHLKQLSPYTNFVLMGDHVTALPHESFTECTGLDYVVSGGDYDFSLLGLAQYLRDGATLPSNIFHRTSNNFTPPNKPHDSSNLDSLPLVDRELTKFHLYDESNIKRRPFAYTMAGRDCPYHECRFCSWTSLYPQFKVRSPENLISEINMLVDNYGVKEIFDDTGTFPSGAWLDKFCYLMIDQGLNKKVILSCNFRFDYLLDPNRATLMKKAGFRLVKSGLESANQLTLDRINKGLRVNDIINGCKIARNAGLNVHLTMMVGFPWETKEEAMNTLSLALYLMNKGLAEVLQSTIVIPYPGTPLYNDSIENDWFRIDPSDYSRYDMTEPVLKTPDMEPEEVMELCSQIYKVYLSPNYIFHRLTKLRSWDDIKYNARGMRAATKHISDFARSKKG